MLRYAPEAAWDWSHARCKTISSSLRQDFHRGPDLAVESKRPEPVMPRFGVVRSWAADVDTVRGALAVVGTKMSLACQRGCAPLPLLVAVVYCCSAGLLLKVPQRVPLRRARSPWSLL
eukprot:1694499-Pleurochrysis_carterae.AAC.1